jgi:hypothetical protein
MQAGVWLYIKSERHLWTVGHYDVKGNWHAESDHGSTDAAVERVRYLNGADGLVLNTEDKATVLAALRLFQRTYEDKDAEIIHADWKEHFNNGSIMPLSTEDIDALCEKINQ